MRDEKIEKIERISTKFALDDNPCGVVDRNKRDYDRHYRSNDKRQKDRLRWRG